MGILLYAEAEVDNVNHVDDGISMQSDSGEWDGNVDIVLNVAETETGKASAAVKLRLAMVRRDIDKVLGTPKGYLMTGAGICANCPMGCWSW